MKTLLIALTMLATPAYADVADDYVACLIGQSAVALYEQGDNKDADAAQEVAFGKCPEPTGISSENEIEGLLDYVNKSVQAIAGE